MLTWMSTKPNDYSRDLQRTAFFTGVMSCFPGLLKFSRSWNIRLPVVSEVDITSVRLEGYADDLIARHRKLVELRPDDDDSHSLLSRLYKVAGMPDNLTMNDLSGNAQGYVVAGSDTVSTTLTYFVWTVCRHPEAKQKLVEELRGLPSDFTDEDLKKLNYLPLVIQEILRLYAAAPAGLPRIVPDPGADFDGHFIPAGTTVMVQAHIMHRDAAIFPDPEIFRPERWASPTKQMKDAFLSFGGGTRVCIGMHLAKAEIRLGVAHFFRTFPNAHVSSLEGMSDADMHCQLYFVAKSAGDRCLISTS